MNRSAAISRTEGKMLARPLVRTWDMRAMLVIAGCMAIPLVPAYFFITGSLRLDEAQSLWQTSRSIPAILAIVAGDVHVPFYHLLLHTWRLYVGDGIIAARLLSLFFFIASIPALYLLGERAYSKRVGLLAAFLFAISPFMNWYATEIRMYTLFAFLTIVNQYLFIRIFRDEKPSDTVWALYGITAVLGIFTHYFFALGLLAQAVFYFVRRELFPADAFWRLLLAAAFVAAAVAPWVWYVYHLGIAGFQDPALVPPSFVNLFSAFVQFLFGFQVDAINTIFLSLWPVVVILGLFTLGRKRMIFPQTQYFFTTVLVSFGVAFVGSFLVAPIFVSRYLAFTIPAFYLIVASMFSAYTPRMRVIAEGSLVALMLLSLTVQIVSPRTPVKENYEGAVAYITEHATAQDTIVVSAPFTVYPVEYYYRGPATISTLPVWDRFAFGPIPSFNEADLPTEAKEVTEEYQNIYLLLSYDQGYAETLRQYFDSQYQRLHTEEFSKALTLYVYRLRYDTAKSAITTTL